MTLTDPADELARACDRLISAESHGNGQSAIASAFDMEPWSKEFYQIIFSLNDQADRVSFILRHQDLPRSYVERAQLHLDGIKTALLPATMARDWSNHDGTRQTLREHVSPVAMLSPTVARTAQYPLLSDEQINDLSAEIMQLIDWLDHHQIEDSDILRAALIDGLRTYHYRLRRIGWLGWEYSAESLRLVIGAYLAVERSQTACDSSPIAQAVLVKTGQLLKSVWKTTGAVNEAVDSISVALKLYGFVSLVRDGTPIVAAITSRLA